MALGGTDGLLEAAGQQGAEVTPEILVEPYYAGLLTLTGLVDLGALTVEVQQTFPLAELAAAHRPGETNRVQGKLVIIH